jgi:hypothetical protein
MDHEVEYCHSSFLFEIRLMIRYITKNMRQFNKKKGDDVDQASTDTTTTRARLGSFENGSRMLLRILECVLAVLILGLVGYALSVYKHTFVSSLFFCFPFFHILFLFQC